MNIKLILDSITLPLCSIVTIIIISKNKYNIANILIGLTVFLGGGLSLIFAILKELFYDYPFENWSLIFAKLSFLSICLTTIPILSFSIFFWRAKYKKIPRVLHSFVFIPALICSVWLFIDPNVLTLNKSSFGIDGIFSRAFLIFTTIIFLLVFILLILELQIMAIRVSYFPSLRRRMNIVTIGAFIGFFGGFLSFILFPKYLPNTLQPATIFVILSSIILTFVFSFTLSRSETKLWHGCPKLLTEKDGSTYCLNTTQGEPIPIKVLDLGDIIERMQIEVDALKTQNGNCANVVFSDQNKNICCITTHEPIKVLEEIVTREEMDLAKNIELVDKNELCSECIHKIIAYRKEHKEKSIKDIQQFFLGIGAEEFFGIK